MAIVIAEALEVKLPEHKSRHTKQQAFLNKACHSSWRTFIQVNFRQKS